MDIRVESLHKQFSGFAALHGIDLSIRSGELIALLGPSGSGKTTLLRALAGLVPIDGGRILFGERDAATLTLRERRVGFVFQHYALFKHLDVFENVAFGLRSRPRRERPAAAEIAARVDALLRRVQLGGLAGRLPDQLSGGQRQRVALARAMAIDPTVLLLDEPFGALDAKVRVELRRWLRQIHDDTGYTTVFVTHDQEEALELADRVVVLNQGRIEQVGTPDEVYRQPVSSFVFDFIGRGAQIAGQARAGQFLVDGRPVYALRSTIGDGPALLSVRPHHFEIAAPEHGLRGQVRQQRQLAGRITLDVQLEAGAQVVEVDLDALQSGLAPAVGARIGLQPVAGTVFRAAD
ncbi:MAG: sulfate ABC transporter ATP-binding protein [Xanthomonadales bacterium]|nr:Sulfate/thiosulfate import ATP-binding protein CysA [Xanthomonadales bacterium]MCC6593898.1 sulfate ABC transporter ATP-binding protein [Xanthomonadales bacterium]MCE7932745.1 sulfate ABC transporter ATP-binding protein [Xanthomonadales bacterium PRO6]